MSGPEGRTRSAPSDAELDRATPRLAGGREVQVGLFVILGVVAFFVVLFMMTDPATFRGRYMIQTEVPDAGGIRRGDPVQMRGVNIGRVNRFDLSPGGVVITLEIEGRWDIPSDSRALLGGGDILGGRTVQVVRGESDTMLQPGQLIPGSTENGILEMADTLGDEARSTMERVRELVSDTTVASVHESIKELRDLLGSLAEMTDEQSGNLNELSTSLQRSAERVEDLTGREELDRSIARVDSTLAELQIASSSLSSASGSLDTILGRVERGEGTLGRLSQDEELYERVSDTLEELSELARDLRENPGRYINVHIF